MEKESLVVRVVLAVDFFVSAMSFFFLFLIKLKKIKKTALPLQI